MYIEVINIGEIIDNLSKIILKKDYTEKAIENLNHIFDRYVFLDIAKFPPQPDGFQDYHQKTDIVSLLDSIEKEGRDYYSFMRDVQKARASLKDLHVSFSFDFSPETKDIKGPYFPPENYNFNQIFLISPVEFIFKENIDTGLTDTFVIKNKDVDELILDSYFPKSLLEKIDNYQNTPIKTINGLSPSDYISQFGENFFTMRNSHAEFTFKTNSMRTITLNNFPLLKNEFYDITIIYQDDTSITYNYVGLKIIGNNEEFNNYSNDILKNYINEPFRPNFLQILEKFFREKGIMKDEQINDILWDVKSPEIKCRVDDTNKVNVIVQNTFSFEQQNLWKFYNCMDLMYSNTYPVIIIEDFNPGGIATLAREFIENAQINSVETRFVSYRLTDSLKKIMEQSYCFTDKEIDTCKHRYDADGKIDKNYVEDKYGDSGELTNKRTRFFTLLPDKQLRKKIDRFKNRYYSKRRKPTDIVVFTDSFCFSACSVFVKGLQITGGAIIAGFQGNPFIKGKKEFDGGQSPAGYNGYCCVDGLYKSNLQNLGITVHSVTLYALYNRFEYKNSKDETIPMEFQVGPVDERTDIYGKYYDDRYDEFIKKGLEIIGDYEDYCNPDNKKLYLDEKKCDPNLHVCEGKICNDEGVWGDSVGRYCDNFNYYFDYNKKECVQNPCSS